MKVLSQKELVQLIKENETKVPRYLSTQKGVYLSSSVKMKNVIDKKGNTTHFISFESQQDVIRLLKVGRSFTFITAARLKQHGIEGLEKGWHVLEVQHI